jgi:hypothetical protein
MRRVGVFAAIGFGALALAPISFAQTTSVPTSGAGEGGGVQGAVGSGGAAAGNLPFTGLNLGVFLLASVVLLVLGFGLRGLAASRS